jgi:hypothetical protein
LSTIIIVASRTMMAVGGLATRELAVLNLWEEELEAVFW